MKYMLLIYSNESAYVGMTEADMNASRAAYGAYIQNMAEAGVLLGTEGLQPVTTATTVRVRDGQTLTTHGPFAETVEQLGGYFIIDCDNLDEAIAWASKCPTATAGSLEIRPVMDYGN